MELSKSIKKYKKTEIIPYILSDHNRIKLEPTIKEIAENTQIPGN
jgi:hypothetical protein